MSWQKTLEKYDTEILVILSTSAVSYILSQWIHANYYLLEYVFLILLFGLIHEAWSSTQTKESTREFIQLFGLDSRTGMQIALLWFVGAAVFISIQLRNLVENVFGPLSVVQMLGIIVVLSRAFVNIYVSKNLFAIFDGARDTYTAYTAGAIAFIVSWQIRDSYAVYTWMHNMFAIWPAIIVPWLLFYYSDLGDNLPKLGGVHGPTESRDGKINEGRRIDRYEQPSSEDQTGENS